MLKFYIESVLINPYTGYPNSKIIEVITDIPELEKVLFEDTRAKGCQEEREILDVARIEKLTV